MSYRISHPNPIVEEFICNKFRNKEDMIDFVYTAIAFSLERELEEYKMKYNMNDSRYEEFITKVITNITDNFVDDIIEEIQRTRCESKEFEIQNAINKIIRELYLPDGSVDRDKLEKEGIVDNGINWGDLKCYSVESCLCAWIDELAPDNTTFRDYILRELSKKFDISEIEIMMEW